MKVLLLNPPYRIKESNGYERFFVRSGSRWPYSEYKKINEPSIYRPFPFFLGYTAALLYKEGYKVEVIDGVALQFNEKNFLDMVLSKVYDFVIIEIAPFSIKNDILIAKKIKEKNIQTRVIAVGPFVSLLVEYIKENQGFDYCINGEYEFAVLNLLNEIVAGREVNIKGVIDLSKSLDKTIEHTDLIETLDNLPMPYREIFPWNERPSVEVYWDVFCQLRPAVQIHTSRGCPYRCYFCLWNQVLYKESKYRTFSVKYVVNEIEYIIKKFDAKEIYIDDDDFTINKNRVREICEEIIRRKLKIKWSCMCDAINLDEELIFRMAKSGCIGIKFGVESVEKNVLKEIGKPVNINKIKNVVKFCSKNGIRTHATFTFGLIGETKNSMKQTLTFAKSLDIDSVQFSIATPYPGTRFYNRVLNNKELKDFDWLNYDGSCKCVVSYINLSNKEIELFYKNVFKKWLIDKCMNLFWILRQLKIFFRTIVNQDIKYSLVFIKRILFKIAK